MSAEPSALRSHNRLWRRLRRRHFFDGLSVIGPVVICPPAICCVSWLLQGPLWVTVICGVLWALINLTMTLITTFTLVLLMRQGAPRQYSVPTCSNVAWPLFFFGATLVALLLGRVDWAFYISFGISPLSGLSKIWPISLSKALHLMLAAALCLAFAKHTVGIFLSLILLEFLRQLCTRPTVREVLTRKSTRAEHVARIRDLSGGGKRITESLLRAECETEHWDEALTELHRHRKGQEFRQHVLVWTAKIYLGLEQYQKVLQLEGKARRAACAIEPYLAVAHARSGHTEEALRVAEEALRLKRSGG